MHHNHQNQHCPLQKKIRKRHLAVQNFGESEIFRNFSSMQVGHAQSRNSILKALSPFEYLTPIREKTDK